MHTIQNASRMWHLIQKPSMIVYTFYTKASEEKNWWRRTDNQPVGCGTSAGSQFHWQQINFEQTDCNRDTTRVLIFSLNFHGFILFSTSIIHAHKSKCFQNSWIYECFHFLNWKLQKQMRLWVDPADYQLISEARDQLMISRIQSEQFPASLEFLRRDTLWMLLVHVVVSADREDVSGCQRYF